MSKLPLNVDDKRVVVSVLVLLLAVVTLNWRVFQPLRDREAAAPVAAQEAVHVPHDLQGMRDVAAARLGGPSADGGAATAGMDGVGLAGRDPFRRPSDPPPPPVRSAPRRDRAARAERLVCAAVMPGGARPTALINGRTCRPGDRVGDYELVAIDSDGVLLAGPAGHRRLAVGNRSGGGAFHPPVRAAGGDTIGTRRTTAEQRTER